MKRKALSWLLALCLIVGLLPTAALAAEDDVGGDAPAVCAELDGCTGDDHDEGCPLYVTPEPADGEEEPEEPPVEETEDPAPVVSPVTALQERINALPGAEALSEMDAEEQAGVYAEVCDIYDAIDELTDEEADALDVSALEEAAAFFTRQIMPLDESDDVAMSGDCGATESDSVIWKLEQNNQDSNDPTYTLTISGSGDMKDYDVGTGKGSNKAPWFSAIQNATTAITAVTIGDDVTSIGDYALSKLSNLKTINGNDTSQTKKIIFPAQLTSWGYSLNGTGFSGVLSFPENCRLKDANSLNIFGNNNITGVDWTNYPLASIPAHWTEYGTAHTALTNLGLSTIPSTVTSIGDYAFKNFQGTSIEIPDASIAYGKGTFVSSKLTTATINVEKAGSKLAESMFSASKDLTTVTFVGNNLTEIPAGTFHDTKISYLAVPYGVTTIKSNTSTDTEHASTFGLGSSSTTLDTSVAFVFPSTLTTIQANNNQDELFGNRTAPNVKILAPALFEWGSITGGLKNIGSGNAIASGFSGLYRYTLATEATCGDTVKVFSITNQSNQTDETTELPSDFGTISYQIENKNVLNDELKAVSAGTTKVEIFIAKSDTEQKTKIAETTITVSPKSVSVTMGASTVDYDGNTKTIEAAAGADGTLPDDLPLVYSYSSDNGTTYTKIPPATPGTYTVKVESGNPNYTLTGTTTAALTISAPPDKTAVSSSNVVVAPASLVYDGSAKSYTATYGGISEWIIVYYDSDGAKLDSAPVNAGDYTVTINGVGKSSYASITKKFTITPATLTITADNKSIYVGGTLPEYTYTVSGLVGEDKLTTAPTVTCSNADANTAGTYTITASGAVAGDNYTITYVDGTLTVRTKSTGGGGGGTTTYAVAVDSAKNGSVSVSPKSAGKGTTVTITVKPDSGYELDDLTVTDKNGDTVKLTRKTDTQYTFTMPASKVTVEASFTTIEEQPTVSFVDVPTSAYYYDAVAWAVENGITNGTSATTFSPDASCTRAQMVTFLWRAAGSPKSTGGNPFTDVSASAYYYDAVLWAVEQGITNGTSATTFSPDATVTRGQTVTFLWRAGGSTAASGGSFADVAADAYYAPAVQWAVANGITNGTSSTTFSPDNACTRGQIVTFMYRDAQ